MRARDSQPRLLRFDRASLLCINESRVRHQLRSASYKGRLRLCSAEKNGKTDAVVQPDSTSFAACEHLTRRAHHAPSAPVTRDSSVLVRVIRGLKMRFISVQTNSMPTREGSCPFRFRSLVPHEAPNGKLQQIGKRLGELGRKDSCIDQKCGLRNPNVFGGNG